MLTRTVNKDLGLKAKDKDSDPKAEAKDLGSKAKDSKYQRQIVHQSSSCSIHHFFIANVV